MTTSSTYGAMQARIADEVLGAVTTTHIVNAIGDAIAKYERQRFYFNEVRDGQNVLQTDTGTTLTGSDGLSLTDSQSLVTVSGQEFYSDADYAIIGSMATIDKMVLLYANNRWPIRRRTPEWMEDVSFSTSLRSIPTDWAWVAGSIRFYPVPNGAYPIFITGTARLPALVNSTDSNAWTQDAEELIRLCAEGILYRRIVRDAAMAAMCQQDEAQALQSLRSETARRSVGAGRIRARW